MRRSTVLEYLQENGPSVTERDRLVRAPTLGYCNEADAQILSAF